MLSELSPEVAVETVSVEPAADGEPRVDSRKLAGPMGVQHPHLFRLLKTHEADFAEMGIVSFQNGLTGKRGMPQRYAMLNEDQAYLLLAYVKNTPEARQLKKHLIVAFRRAREALEGRVSVDSVSLEEAFKIERAHGAPTDAAIERAMDEVVSRGWDDSFPPPGRADVATRRAEARP